MVARAIIKETERDAHAQTREHKPTKTNIQTNWRRTQRLMIEGTYSDARKCRANSKRQDADRQKGASPGETGKHMRTHTSKLTDQGTHKQAHANYLTLS